MTDKINIIVESGYNTSYISTLLIALFYNNTYIDDLLLSRYLNTQKNIYLQETIKFELIEKVKKNQSILSDSINKIRFVSHLLGWQTLETLFKNHNVIDYLNFLLKKFEGLTYCKHNSITCIDINTNENSSVIREFYKIIDTIFTDSYFDDSNYNKNNIVDYQSKIPVIRLKKLFPLITIHINREKNNYPIEIEKKFKVRYLINESIIDIDWEFHSLIGLNNVYYTLISFGKKWYIFSDTLFPSFTEVDMSNPKFINKIKLEAILIIYKTKFC